MRSSFDLCSISSNKKIHIIFIDEISYISVIIRYKPVKKIKDFEFRIKYGAQCYGSPCIFVNDFKM